MGRTKRLAKRYPVYSLSDRMGAVNYHPEFIRCLPVIYVEIREAKREKALTSNLYAYKWTLKKGGIYLKRSVEDSNISAIV